MVGAHLVWATSELLQAGGPPPRCSFGHETAFFGSCFRPSVSLTVAVVKRNIRFLGEKLLPPCWCSSNFTQNGPRPIATLKAICFQRCVPLKIRMGSRDAACLQTLTFGVALLTWIFGCYAKRLQVGAFFFIFSLRWLYIS